MYINTQHQETVHTVNEINEMEKEGEEEEDESNGESERKMVEETYKLSVEKLSSHSAIEEKKSIEFSVIEFIRE